MISILWINITPNPNRPASGSKLPGDVQADRDGQDARQHHPQTQEDPGQGDVNRADPGGIRIPREQQARLFELRAALSLVRLWASPGQREEAKVVLASIDIWFSEGFDTVDLIEAKALLDDLA